MGTEEETPSTSPYLDRLRRVSGLKNFGSVWPDPQIDDPAYEKKDYLFNMHRPIDARVGRNYSVLLSCHLHLCVRLRPGQWRAFTSHLLLIGADWSFVEGLPNSILTFRRALAASMSLHYMSGSYITL